VISVTFSCRVPFNTVALVSPACRLALGLVSLTATTKYATEKGVINAPVKPNARRSTHAYLEFPIDMTKSKLGIQYKLQRSMLSENNQQLNYTKIASQS